MYTNVTELKKEPFFYYFEQISRIPRIPGNELEISDYLVDFARKRNLDVMQDDTLNVMIKKPATKGYEEAPTLIIQGHMDMVCEKNKGTNHDFSKDPLQLSVEGDMLYATGTTLGADNGIAVAYALALLDSAQIAHPRLEVVITTQEETSMGGALAVDGSELEGEFFINIDHESDHELLVSGAGGLQGIHRIPIEWSDNPRDNHAYRIRIQGLHGGHSGLEIHKGLGNANKIMGRFLYAMNEKINVEMGGINGGFASNAIPREVDATVFIKEKDKADLDRLLADWNHILTNEYKHSDPAVTIQCENLDYRPHSIFSNDTKDKLIASLMLIPNGIQTMSMEIEGLVESSTNLGVVTTNEEEIVLESDVRSSVKSLKYDIVDRSQLVADYLHCHFHREFDYPAWPYKEDSQLKKLFEEVHQEKYGYDPEIVAVHAGIECGIFLNKIPNLDVIAFGPDIYNAHTPNEHLCISSALRNWEYLLLVLEKAHVLEASV